MAGHGGAWKVAYADFVTAMMALFMVLWISAQDKEILISTSQYFQNPFRSPMDASSGVMPFNSNKSSSNNSDGGLDRSKQVQMSFLNSVAADFYRLLNLDESMASKPIDIQVTSDGLRVTLFDRAKQPLFARDSTDLTEWGTFVLQAMAWTIERHKFNVTIDGHAGVRPVNKPGYDNWDLSADRANASRRVLVHYAVDPRQIERVTGYADTRPIPGETGPESNERITLNLTLTAKGRAKDGPAKESPTKERPTKEGPVREALPGEKAAVVTPAH